MYSGGVSVSISCLVLHVIVVRVFFFVDAIKRFDQCIQLSSNLYLKYTPN